MTENMAGRGEGLAGLVAQIQKLRDEASKNAASWHSTHDSSREQRAHWMTFYEGRKAAFEQTLDMLATPTQLIVPAQDEKPVIETGNLITPVGVGPGYCEDSPFSINRAALEAAAPAGTAPRPYRALNEGGGCKECHHGDDWTVVYAPTDGSEEIGEGESWDNESPADEMAESLNDAFERGWRAALANTFSTTSAREQSSATASANLSVGDTVKVEGVVVAVHGDPPVSIEVELGVFGNRAIFKPEALK